MECCRINKKAVIKNTGSNPYYYSFLLFDSPHRGDSYEHTQYTLFNIKKKITLNYSAAMFFSKGLENEFDTSVTDHQCSEPLKFYCRRLLYLILD